MDLQGPLTPAAVPVSTWLSPCPRGQCCGAAALPYFPEAPGIIFAPRSPLGCDSWKGRTRLFLDPLASTVLGLAPFVD